MCFFILFFAGIAPHSPQQRPAQRIQHQPQPVLRELPAAKPTPKAATLPSPKRLIEEAASKHTEASPPKKAKVEIDVSVMGDSMGQGPTIHQVYGGIKGAMYC